MTLLWWSGREEILEWKGPKSDWSEFKRTGGKEENIIFAHMPHYRQTSVYCASKILCWDFPGGAVVKNPPANAGDTYSSPGPGRAHTPWSN